MKKIKKVDLEKNIELKYQAIAKDQKEMICRFKPDGTLTYVSESYARNWGKTSNELINVNFLKMIPENAHEGIKKHLNSFSPENEFKTHEHEVFDRDGKIRWHEWSNRAFFDNNGKLVEFQAIGRDITKRKLTEEKLRENEEKYRVFFETTMDSLYITSRDGRWLDMNDAAVKLFGYASKEELLKVSTRDLYINPDDRNNYTKIIDQKGFIKEHPFDLKKKDGSKIHALVTAVPVKDKQGIIVSYQGIIRDITERKKSEEALLKSEEKFSKSFRSSPLAILITRLADGQFVEVNEAVERLSGYSREEVIGHTSLELELVNPMDRKRVLQKLRDHGSFSNFETRFFTKAGEERVGLFSGEIIEINGEKCIIQVVNDITEKQSAEIFLTKAMSLLQATLESTADGILVVDLQGRIVDYNNQFIKIWKITHDIFPEGKTKDLVSPENAKHAMKHIIGQLIDPEEFIARVQELYAKPEDESFDVLKFKDGRVLERYSKPQLIDGLPVGRVWSFRDVTDHKNAEENLIKAKEKAEESDCLKSAFLANMSHEIRTPMNGILGFAELLKEPNLSGSDQKKYIDIIENSGHRMLNTINDLIHISKIEAGQVEVSVSDVNVNTLIKYFYSFFKPEVEKKGLQLNIINSLPDTEAIIKTDRSKLNSILTNLIKNAIKYTPEGDIEFGYKKNGEYLEFFVKDTGIGIPGNRQQLIFERFVQANNEDTKAFEGSGLGLAITKAYVEMLGGKLWVESCEGVGSEFYFIIPYVVYDNEPTAVEAFKPVINNISKFKDLNILIAEDENEAVMHLSILLKDIGKEIYHAKNGIEVVEICHSVNDLDLILMDIRMPEMNGYEATKEIRKFNKDIIIIAQTAYALEGDRENAIAAGCNDHIAKPVSKESLVRIINKYF